MPTETAETPEDVEAPSAAVADGQLRLLALLESAYLSAVGLTSIVHEYAPFVLTRILCGSGLTGDEQEQAVAKLRKMMPAGAFERIVAESERLD